MCFMIMKIKGLNFLILTAAMAHKSFQPIVLVHGGAGDIPDSRVSAKLDGVCRAARKGYEILQKTGSVLDGIVAAVELMEDEPAFNAGAVTLVKNIAHPISLARRVMVETPHAFLGGEAVNEFAARMGVPTVPDDYLFTSAAQAALDHFKQAKSIPSKMEIGEVGVGTVGSVAIDAAGHMASATSTGGITGKYNGRIGDTPLLGCGGYADDERGTVSTTGHGETIMRYNLAQRILADIASGKSAQEGTKDQCEGMTKRLNNTGGAITISSRGEVGVFFTSKRMAWAYQLGDELHYGIEHGQHLVDKV
ncbi:probable isoaspartyl peptidase/L-asparaginase GA20639 isoform X3 [Macrosteles quadrilineatus]|uniref:probable isoaspartyl peptidase/L-asparaginase GA20639 isoform X3 n=1 Tax=Macrosteles quadrilineatus TaxID=74068 RepID=UPI0023E0D00D|nr:probable isoaspartyl peptidase/L-asparaginase GA20639 isoform X3 [Macrosteles quadrilineatus]